MNRLFLETIGRITDFYQCIDVVLVVYLFYSKKLFIVKVNERQK